LKAEYRDGVYRVRVRLGYSNLLVVSDRAEGVSAAITALTYHKAQLQAYLTHNPLYRYSLEPVEVEGWAPQVVKLAAEAAWKAGVGPMAAIPGALAELALKALTKTGARIGLVEDGGEIAACSNKPLTLAIYAGNSPLSGKVGFHLTPEDFPLGVATSSATVSHAVNFGEADAAVVVASSAALADAAAKAVCNAVKGVASEAVRKGLEKAEEIEGVRGALIICGSRLGAVGKLPKIIKLEGSPREVLEAALHFHG